MLKRLVQFTVILMVVINLVLSGSTQQKVSTEKKNNENQKKVAALFQINCAVSGCHQGQHPKKKLNLEADKFLINLVDIPSLQVDSLKRVDTNKPENSYLLMKVKDAKGIVGERMPDEAPALKPEEIAVIEQWVYGLKAVTQKTGAEKMTDTEKKTKK